MLETLDFTLTGVSALMMQNGQMADPLNPHTLALKEVTSKRKKVEEDHEEISRIEWFGGLYVNDEGAPCIPGDMLEAFAVEGAKKSKLGKQLRAAMFCEEDSFPLLYGWRCCRTEAPGVY